MNKYFNIAGPCNSNEHYMIPSVERTSDIASLIEQKQYFVIHAARQTGKTTLLHQLVDDITEKGKYYALYCSLESVQIFTDPKDGIPEILNTLKSTIKYSKLPEKNIFAKDIRQEDISSQIRDSLRDFCIELDKPLIIFFDEVDCLSNGTLITFLRQLRDGYVSRNRIPFLHSVALVGMRNIRDYKTNIREGRETLGSASPFNIITKTLTLNNFTIEEVENLYIQHTKEKGQIFKKEAVEKAFYYSQGQPWLVNAIAREIVVEILKNDYSIDITPELVEQAAENIMLRRDTHIDSLLERLKEERVRRIIEPLLLGNSNFNMQDDDTQYCLDLGLIKIHEKELMPANPIYNELIIRALTYDAQFHLNSQIENIWIDDKGNIDMNGLLKNFQQFWRENSDIWIEKYEYKEAAPHLILQAFLQRIINKGGDILREYAGGRERMDLCVRYGGSKYPLELKLYYNEKTVPKGIKQLSNYMDTLGEKTGWLIVFDRAEKIKKSWEEKIYWQTKKTDGNVIHVVGC